MSELPEEDWDEVVPVGVVEADVEVWIPLRAAALCPPARWRWWPLFMADCNPEKAVAAVETLPLCRAVERDCSALPRGLFAAGVPAGDFARSFSREARAVWAVEVFPC